MSMADTIARKLEEALSPTQIEVRDVSHTHAGHAGWREGGETHFEVVMISDAFAGKSRVQQHQMVYKALGGRMGGELHALALQTSAPPAD